MTSLSRFRRLAGFVLALSTLAAVPLWAQVSSSAVSQRPTGGRYSLLSLGAAPFLSIPLGADAEVFALGGGSELQVTYRLPSLPLLFVQGRLGYGFVPSIAPGTTISTISLGAAAGARFGLLPFMSLSLYGGAGYFLGMLNGPGVAPGGNPFATGGVSFDFDIADSWSIGVGGAYRYFGGLFGDTAVAVSGTYHLPAMAVGRSIPLPDGFTPLSNDGRGLRIVGLKADPIFPVFSKYYDQHPLAEVALRNFEGVPAEKIKLTAIVKGYMDGARESEVPVRIEPGKGGNAQVLGLFNDRLLEVAEQTKLTLSLVLEYSQYGKAYRDEYTPTIDVLYRNAMIWEDDRRMAAFISARDPAASGFARGVLAAARDARNPALNPDLQSAMLIYESLRSYGLIYTKDPASALASGDKKAVDTLQFPQETLASRNGDCDDLSILFCSMLESIGMETAFITTPGHVFAAFQLGMRPEDASKAYGKPDDFVVRDGKAWVPVELTALSADFLGAWKEGARQWNAEKGGAAFYPVRDAWKTFAPVVVSGAAKAPTLPAPAKLSASLKSGIQALVSREMSPRAEALLAETKKSGAQPRTFNSLGVLYARYGQYDKAMEQFTKASAKGDYRPALVNIGNIYLTQKQYQKAVDQFRKVLRLSPEDAYSLAGVAMAFDGLGKRGDASDAYQKLKVADPGLAEQFAYLDTTRTDGVSRAAEADSKEAKIPWND